MFAVAPSIFFQKLSLTEQKQLQRLLTSPAVLSLTFPSVPSLTSPSTYAQIQMNRSAAFEALLWTHVGSTFYRHANNTEIKVQKRRSCYKNVKDIKHGGSVTNIYCRLHATVLPYMYVARRQLNRFNMASVQTSKKYERKVCFRRLKIRQNLRNFEAK